MSEIEHVQEDQEVEEIQEEAQAVSAEEIEAIASAQGWAPDKGEKTALEFLRDGKEYRDRLYQEVRSLREDNQRAYGIVAEHITQQNQRDHAVEQASIEEQIKEAAEEGNTEKVIELTQKLKEPPPAPQRQDPTIEFIQKWRADNSWYNDDPDMNAVAQGFYRQLANQVGDNPQAILPQVEQKVKELFADKFAPKNPNRTRSAGVEGQGRKKSAKVDGLGKADLTEDEQAHFDQFVKMGMKPDELLSSIERAREMRR